jgi:hypothetical protein
MSKLWIILSGILGFISSFVLFLIGAGCANDIIGLGFGVLILGAILWLGIYFLGIAAISLPRLPGAISGWLERRAKKRARYRSDDRIAKIEREMRYDEIKMVAGLLLMIAAGVLLLIGLAYLVGYLHMLIVC